MKPINWPIALILGGVVVAIAALLFTRMVPQLGLFANISLGHIPISEGTCRGVYNFCEGAISLPTKWPVLGAVLSVCVGIYMLLSKPRAK